jgi:hypothetical protein
MHNNSEWSRLFRRPGVEGRTIIKMDIEEIKDWTHLTLNINQFRDLETMDVNFRVPYKAEYLFAN